MAFSIKLTGDKAVDKWLAEFEPKLRKKVLNQSARKGMKIVQAAAKAKAPVGETGALKSSIKVRATKRSRKSFGIDVRITRPTDEKAAWYGPSVEFGDKDQDGRNFLEDAFKTAGPQAEQVAIDDLRKGIAQIAKER